MFLTPDSCVLKDVQNRSPAGGRGGSDGRNSLGKRCPLKSFLLSLFAGSCSNFGAPRSSEG